MNSKNPPAEKVVITFTGSTATIIEGENTGTFALYVAPDKQSAYATIVTARGKLERT